MAGLLQGEPLLSGQLDLTVTAATGVDVAAGVDIAVVQPIALVSGASMEAVTAAGRKLVCPFPHLDCRQAHAVLESHQTCAVVAGVGSHADGGLQVGLVVVREGMTEQLLDLHQR